MVKRILDDESQLCLRLWLVGDDAGAESQIREFITTHHLESVVSLFGHCSDTELGRLYAEADIFALPTLQESFGIVFLEAMAHGLPVITYGTGPVPNILTHGALVVAPGDTEAFGAQLRKLIENQDMRWALAREAHGFSKSFLDWSQVADRLLALYGGIVANTD
jgi:glycosyltransferase involved in cell wall biosynthesis